MAGVKYADGPQTEVEVQVAVPPQQLWPLVVDIELPARFSPELQRVEWLDGAGQAAVGTSFAGYNFNPLLGEWRTVAHVVECDPPRAFGFVVVDADGVFGDPQPPSPQRPAASWRFELVPSDGGTVLRQTVRIGPARSGVNLAIDQRPEREDTIIELRLRELGKGMLATLDGIKQLAER